MNSAAAMFDKGDSVVEARAKLESRFGYASNCGTVGSSPFWATSLAKPSTRQYKIERLEAVHG